MAVITPSKKKVTKNGLSAKKRKVAISTSVEGSKRSGNDRVKNPKKARIESVPQNEEEAAFPRGGSIGVTPLEYRQIAEEVDSELMSGATAEQDTDMGVSENLIYAKKGGKKNSANNAAKKSSKSHKKIEPISGNRKFWVDESGSVNVLGYISQVNDLVAKVSLPGCYHNGDSGKLEITNVNDFVESVLEKETGLVEENETDAGDVSSSEDEQSEDDDGEDEEDEDDGSEDEVEEGNGMDEEASLSVLETSHSESISLKKYLHIGQMLPFAVVHEKSEKGSKVSLSLNPKLINQGITSDNVCEGYLISGYISSVEDHGLIIDVGVDSMSAFCSNADSAEFLKAHCKSTGQSLNKMQLLGLPVLCSVREGYENGRVVNVTLDPNVVNGCVAKNHQGKIMTVGSLKAGNVVNAHVVGHETNGLHLSFLDGLKGYVDQFHLPSLEMISCEEGAKERIAEAIPLKSKVKAKVLYVDPESKIISLSLKNVSSEAIANGDLNFVSHCESLGLRHGKVVEDAEIVRVDKGFGLYVSVCEGLRGFVHYSNASDAVTGKNSLAKYNVGFSTHCRVIGFNSFDRLVLLSCQKSVLEKKFLNYAELKPGMKVDGAVMSVKNDVGLVVSLDKNIKGLVTKNHLSDLPSMKNPEKRFKEGDSVTCRILQVDPDAKKLTLTCKKSLTSLTEEDEILNSYEMAKLNTWFVGTVGAVKPFGCIVNFFNGVHGLISLNEFTKPMSPSNVGNHFKVGQIVRCRVIHCLPQFQKLKLSLRDGVATASTAFKFDNENLFKVGDVVEGVVTGDKPGSFDVRISRDNGDGSSVTLNAALPFDQLSDSFSGITLMRKAIAHCKVGSKTVKAVVLFRDSRNRVYLTLKESFKWCFSNGKYICPPKVDNLKIGMLAMGYVRQIAKFGCFIGFPNGLSGLLPTAEICDRFVADPNEVLGLGQSVLVRVSTVEEISGKFTVSMKGISESLDELEKVCNRGFVGDLSNIDKSIYLTESNIASWKKVKVGQVVACSVIQLQDFGAVTNIEDADGAVIEGKQGLITKQQCDAEYKVGDSVKCVVLDVNYEAGLVDLSAKQQLVSQATRDFSRGLKKIAKKLKDSSDKMFSVSGTIVLVKKDLVISSLNSEVGGCLAMFPVVNPISAGCVDLNVNSKHGVFNMFKVGDTVHGRVFHLPGAFQPGEHSSYHCLMVPDKASYELQVAKDERNKNALRSVGNVSTGKFVVQPGHIVEATITSKHATQMNVEVRDPSDERSISRGRINICEVMDDENINVEASSSIRAFDKFKKGDSITAVCIGFHDAKTHKFLPISHSGKRANMLELSVKPKVLAMARKSLEEPGETFQCPKPLCLEDLKPGKACVGFVQEIADEYLWVQLAPSIRGRVHMLDVGGLAETVTALGDHFERQQPVKCYILKVNFEKGMVDLSLRPVDELTGEPIFKIGDVVCGKIEKVTEPFSILARLSSRQRGQVFVTELSDNFSKNPLSSESMYTTGSLINCCVTQISQSKHGKDIHLSLRQSVVCKDEEAVVVDARITTIEDVKSEMVVRGYVKSISKSGCFVYLSSNVVARAKIAELSDSFVKHPEKVFPVGALVSARVIGVDVPNQRIEITLKTSIVDPASFEKLLTFDKMQCFSKESPANPACFYKGTIKQITDFGIFVKVRNSHLTGLVHTSEILDKKIVLNKREKETMKAKLLSMYKVNDLVKVVCLKKEVPTKKIYLGMKASYFENCMDIDSDDEEVDGEVEHEFVNESDDDEEENAESSSDDDNSEESASETEDSEPRHHDDADNSQLEVPKSLKRKREATSEDEEEEEGVDLGISGKMDWDEASDTNEAGVSSDEEVEEDEDAEEAEASLSKSAKKRAKKAEKKNEESKITDIENALALNDSAPQSADEFDRLLLGSPNSSYLWIQYIAFHLNMADIIKARSIVERALSTISPVEESERFNVWVAYLNMENVYGSKESMSEAIKRCMAVNDPKKVCLSLVKIYEKSEKLTECEEAFKLMLKKFRQSKKVYILYGQFLIQNKRVEDARAILQKGLLALPKHKHIATISKFAQMEFRFGSVERGRTVFEGMLDSYPKRLDLWSVYLDMEMKVGDSAAIRRLFERVVHMKLSSKKMKFFLKRYLEYEKTQGTKETVSHVKELAMNYVVNSGRA